MKTRILYILTSFFSLTTVFCQVGINTETVSPGIALEVNGKVKIDPISVPAAGAEKLIVVMPDGTLAQTNSGKVGITTVINKNISLNVTNNTYGTHSLIGSNMPYEGTGTEKKWVTTDTFSPISNGSLRMKVNFILLVDNEINGLNSSLGIVQVTPYLYRVSDNAIVSQSISSFTCYPCEDGGLQYGTPTILANDVSSSESYYLLFSYKILQQSAQPDNKISYDFGSVNIELFQANEVEL